MSPADREATQTVGPETLPELLEKTPPSAIILGTEMDFLEDGLFRTAVESDQQSWKRKVYENGPVVYFRR